MLRRSFIQAIGAVFAVPAVTAKEAIDIVAQNSSEVMDGRTQDKVILQIWSTLTSGKNAHDSVDIVYLKEVHKRMSHSVVNAVLRLNGDGRAYAKDGSYTPGFSDESLEVEWKKTWGQPEFPCREVHQAWNERFGPIDPPKGRKKLSA